MGLHQRDLLAGTNRTGVNAADRDSADVVGPIEVGDEHLHRRIRVDLDPSLDLTPAGAAGPLEIIVVADGETYERFDPALPGATFDIGEFEPANATLDFRARFDPTVAGAHPFRVIVEGAESQPFWIELP